MKNLAFGVVAILFAITLNVNAQSLSKEDSLFVEQPSNPANWKTYGVEYKSLPTKNKPVEQPAYNEEERYTLSEIVVSGGKSPITSGLDVKVTFQKENKILGGRVNHQRVFAFTGRNLDKLNTVVLFTGGFFQNTPWAGAEIISSPTKYFTFIGWYGHATNPLGEKLNWNPESFFTYLGAFFQLSDNLSLSYTLQEFEGWMNLPGIKYSKNLSENYSWFAGADYWLEEKEPMFSLGIVYIPGEKDFRRFIQDLLIKK